MWVHHAACLLLVLVSGKLATFKESFDFSEGSWFVMYFAPWCSHCKTIKPDFIQAASSTQTKLVLVDCELYTKFCSAQGVKKFPTLTYYSEDFVHSYTLGRSAKDFQDFLLKVNSPAYSNTTAEALPAHESAYVLHLHPSDSKALTTFSEVAKEHRASPAYFYTVPDSETYLAVGGRDAELNYTLLELTGRNMRLFVDLHTLPTVVELDSSNSQSIRTLSQDRTLVILAYDQTSQSQDALEVLKEVAIDLRTKGVKSVQVCTMDFAANAKQVEAYQIDRAPALLKIVTQDDTKMYAKRTEGFDKTGVLELIYRVEVHELSTGMWNSAKKLGKIAVQAVCENLLVYAGLVGVLAFIVGMLCLTSKKAKHD
jgi:thiol-disulfide isomerase/thioredoxin